MKRLVLTAAIAAAVGLPALALAQTAPAPMICMAAKAGETANAMMGSSQMVCHPVDVAKVQAATKTLTSMMDTKMMTSDQMSHMKAAEASINEILHFPAIPGVSSNPNAY